MYALKQTERGRKRKLSETDLSDSDPPAKKARTSTSSTTDNSNSKTKTNKSSSSPSKAKAKAKAKPKPKTSKGGSSKNKNSKKTYKGNEPTEQIRRKMLELNRPFTASALRAEMNEKVGIAQVKKSLAELEQDGLLSLKEFGTKKTKNLVYWWNQDGFSDDEEDYNEMEIQQQIQELETTVQQKKAEMNRIKNQCLKLQKEPTDKQIESNMENIWKELQHIKAELESMEGDGVERVTQENVDKLLLESHRYLKEWKERKNKVWDMINLIFMDARDKPPKLLTDKCGGETDKENDVSWDDYKEMYKAACRVKQQQRDKTNSKNKK